VLIPVGSLVLREMLASWGLPRHGGTLLVKCGERSRWGFQRAVRMINTVNIQKEELILKMWL
jgi:hypothetical protein